MKYIDADKLIAEIERRTEETKSMKPAFDQFWAGQVSAFKGAIKIIESLQQEQPSEDLEKEYKEYVDNDPVYSKLTNRFVGMLIARHFYELGLNARKEEEK